MKNLKFLNVFCAFALALSLTSFTTDKKKNREEKNSGNSVVFDASLYKVSQTSKVRLAVDKNSGDQLKIVLKDRLGRVYYTELYNQKEANYRRVFDLAEMSDGIYLFEMIYQKHKVTKEVEISSTNEKLISLQ